MSDFDDYHTQLGNVCLTDEERIAAAVLAERERCAKIAERHSPASQDSVSDIVADAVNHIAGEIRKGDPT